MKKQLLLLLAGVLTIQVSAQQDSESRTVRSKYNSAPAIEQSALLKLSSTKNVTPGVAAVIFSEDFAAGLPSTWTVTDVTATFNEIWAYSTTGSVNSPTALGTPVTLSPTNTTASNGFMLFDSDIGGPPSATSGPEDSDLKTPAINCSTSPVVFLSFNEVFVQYQTGVGLVSVSNDGTTWTDVYNAETGLGQNQSSPNPRNVVVDISTVAGNQATVFIRFKWTGNYDWVWIIDDVTVYEPVAADAGAIAIVGTESGCALSATTPITVTVRNFGGASISNVPVSYSINGGTPITETVAGPIASNATLDYTFTATADLSVAGIYTINASTALTGDTTTANDASSIQVESFSANNLATPYVMDFEVGEDLSQWLVNDVNGDGVSWALVNALAYSGTECLRKAGSGDYDDDWAWTGCFDLQAGVNYTLDYWYRQFDLQAPCSLEVKLATAQDPSSSTQLIATEVIDSIYHNSVNTVTVGTSGVYYVAFHAFVPNPSPVVGSSSLRVDLINLSIATAINENANPGGVSIFPNPSNGVVNLRVMKFENATIRVINILGKEIYNSRMSDINTQIDLSNFAKGLYIVKVDGTDFSYSERVTIK
jgi:hypothetical protein